MDKKLLEYISEKSQELINSSTCSNGAKSAAESWLKAVGTENEASETKDYFAELESDIMPIDSLINFAESDNGVNCFGADAAKSIAKHAREIKSSGAKYCDCPACAAAEAILQKKNDILK